MGILAWSSELISGGLWHEKEPETITPVNREATSLKFWSEKKIYQSKWNIKQKFQKSYKKFFCCMIRTFCLCINLFSSSEFLSCRFLGRFSQIFFTTQAQTSNYSLLILAAPFPEPPSCFSFFLTMQNSHLSSIPSIVLHHPLWPKPFFNSQISTIYIYRL